MYKAMEPVISSQEFSLLDELNIPNQENIDALITERLLLFRERLVDDFGLVQVKPKSTSVPVEPSNDSYYSSLQTGE